MPKNKTKKRNKGNYNPIEEPEYKGDNILRYPRPLGTTYALTLAYQNTDIPTKTKLIDRIKQKLIELYVNNNMEINGKMIKINEFANYLNIKPQTLLILMNKEVERISNFFDGKEGKQIARVQFFTAQKKALEILALTAQQTNILMAQQKGKYVPFLTGEVNRSLGNLINAQKPMHDLIKLLMEKNQINILINTDGTSKTSGTDYISPEQAREMITQMGPSIYMNPVMIEAKEKTLLGLPEVCARDQDLSSIGVRQSTIPDTSKVPNRVPNEVQNADDFIA